MTIENNVNESDIELRKALHEISSRKYNLKKHMPLWIEEETNEYRMLSVSKSKFTYHYSKRRGKLTEHQDIPLFKKPGKKNDNYYAFYWTTLETNFIHISIPHLTEISKLFKNLKGEMILQNFNNHYENHIR